MTFYVFKFLEQLRKLINFGHNNASKMLIEIHLIINPAAGAFRSKKTLEGIAETLARKIDSLKDEGVRQKKIDFHEYFTESPGHAKFLATTIAHRKSNALYKLIITGGGDGTCNEVCSGLMAAENNKVDEVRVMRLPLGSGNDGTDIKNIEDTYNLILGNHHYKRINVLQIAISGRKTPIYSFNIASLGVDAYVTAWANKFKKILGKKSYKVASNIFPAFYIPLFQPYLRHFTKSASLKLHLFERNGATVQVEKNLALLAMGCSGFLTYGGGIKVLPKKQNVCLVEQIGLLKLFRYKHLLFNGRHDLLKEVSFYDCKKVIIDKCTYGIPFQFDGESILLHPWQFPLMLTWLEKKINIVTKSDPTRTGNQPR